MKKPSSAKPARTPPRSPAMWRNLALIFGASTLALAIMLVRVSNALDTVSAAERARSSVADASGFSRELRPYAALGTNLAENNRIADLGWSPAQFDAFLAGLRSSYEGRGVPMNDDAEKLRAAVSERVQSMLASENPDPLETYFRSLRENEGVQRTSSGLHYRITEPGEGEPPRPEDTVVVSLTAQLPDGKKLPFLNLARTRVVLRDMLPGLAEGLKHMKVGSKALVYVPPQLGFGSRPPAGIPDGAPVIYFVELHDILPPEETTGTSP